MSGPNLPKRHVQNTQLTQSHTDQHSRPRWSWPVRRRRALLAPAASTPLGAGRRNPIGRDWTSVGSEKQRRPFIGLSHLKSEPWSPLKSHLRETHVAAGEPWTGGLVRDRRRASGVAGVCLFLSLQGVFCPPCLFHLSKSETVKNDPRLKPAG